MRKTKCLDSMSLATRNDADAHLENSRRSNYNELA